MENVVGIVLNFLMVLVILMMVTILIIFVRANMQVMKSRSDIFKVNLTGKKVARILLDAWQLKDVKERMLADPKKDGTNYSTYDFNHNELILTPQVYKTKSFYAVTIAIYESIRTKQLREKATLVSQYVKAKKWFWIILAVLLIFLLKPITLLTKQHFIWMDLAQVLFLLVVVGAYLLYVNKLEVDVVKSFPQALAQIPVLTKDEQAHIMQIAQAYHYMMIARPDKFIAERQGGHKDEK
jgi:Zn-dependent membrane protease YugP